MTPDDFLRWRRPDQEKRLAQLFPMRLSASRSASNTNPGCSRPTPSSRWAFGYFLIVADFINWAKQNQGAGGAGAGFRPARWWPSACASPISAGLRPAVRALPQSWQVSMPDFDIDPFCQDNRYKVIEVCAKYGGPMR